MAVCEVSTVEENVRRHVLMWQSSDGVVMCDGASIQTVSDDIEIYWDENDSNAIPSDRIDDSYGWYDPDLNAYKLLISSGSGQSTHNVELEYSLVNNEWTKLYREKTSGANPLQTACIVRDTNGNNYSYGFTDEGYCYRLENGNTWAEADGSNTAITQFVWTKDLILGGAENSQPLLKQTLIDWIRLNFETKSTAATEDMSFTHYCDRTQTTDGSDGQDVPSAYDMANGPVETDDCTLGQCLYHSIKISADMSTVADGMELLGLGLVYTAFDVIDTED
jgi:hypothetical protein